MTEIKEEKNASLTVEWVLWEHKCGQRVKTSSQWKQNASEVAHFFHTEPPFSCDLGHLPLPSKTFFLKDTKDEYNRHQAPPQHTEYSLFKKDIFPQWEDPSCANGGILYSKQYFPAEFLDHYWKRLVKGVLEGEIEDTHVCGVRVVDKSKLKHPLYKVEIWLDSADQKIREQIRDKAMQAMRRDEPLDEHQMHPLKLHWRDFSRNHGGSDD